MDVEKLVGWNVARLRAKMRLSQGELASRALVIDQSYLSGLENGKRNPTAVVLTHIAGALDVQVGELFSPNGAPKEILEGPIRVKSGRSKKTREVL